MCIYYIYTYIHIVYIYIFGIYIYMVISIFGPAAQQKQSPRSCGTLQRAIDFVNSQGPADKTLPKDLDSLSTATTVKRLG